LGSLPGAPNVQIGHAPAAAGPPAAAGQENAPVAGKKRKSTAEEQVPAEPIHWDSIDLRNAKRENCDEVRLKINRFLESGEMSKTAFAREIGVSPKSLNGFLGVHGPGNGAKFNAYDYAWEYFAKREIMGLKMPAAKKQKTGAPAAAGAATAEGEGGGSTAKAPASKASAGKTPAVDLSDIVLDEEDDDDMVPVFDTCDEVRKKINAYFKKTGMSQAEFCRTIHAALGGRRPAKVFQGAQLASFRKSKGPLAGVKSAVFYAAYVFFEKLRIKEKKPKSKHRQTMEELWGFEGMDMEYDHRTS
jgi:hypothetical protein